jgi:hypothetical protein
MSRRGQRSACDGHSSLPEKSHLAPQDPSITAPPMTIVNYAPWPVVPPSRAAIGIANRCRFEVHRASAAAARATRTDNRQCYGGCHTSVTYRHARKKSKGKGDSEIGIISVK